MKTRLAGEFALLAAAAVLGRGLMAGEAFEPVLQSALWAGLFSWAAGYAAAEIVGRLALEKTVETAQNAPEDSEPK